MDRSSIIAVASSAGDLEAISELLSGLPPASGGSFIVVQHLDPARRGMSLREALASRTYLRVVDAYDGVVPERGHVYVARAGTVLTITRSRISLTPTPSGLHHPGDTLLTSLAENSGKSAIGVVLSGGGSDGARGIQSIKKAGGTTFAQYPGSARFPSMPISAIETGCVGYVLRPNEIARELTSLSRLNPLPESITRRVSLVGVSVAGCGLRRSLPS
jgi:two-component system CheB/CheR fusion protein